MIRTAARWETGSAIRILLVDSDMKVLETLRSLLEMHGHKVYIAVNAEACLLLAQQHVPHVICTGIELEGTGGYELAKQLRRLPETSRSLLIALADHSNEGDANARAEVGFDDFLLKPANCEDILNLLNHVINA